MSFVRYLGFMVLLILLIGAGVVAGGVLGQVLAVRLWWP